MADNTDRHGTGHQPPKSSNERPSHTKDEGATHGKSQSGSHSGGSHGRSHEGGSEGHRSHSREPAPAGSDSRPHGSDSSRSDRGR